MAILDSKGRLFGKFSILDVGAAFVILMVVFGIFLFPGTSGTSVVGQGKPEKVEVDVIVKGLSARDPKSFIKEGSKVGVLVRKVRSGEAELKSVEFLPRELAVP